MAPQLHNLALLEDKDQPWITRKNKRSHVGVSEDKKLELRLGLPGDHTDHDHHGDKRALLVQADDSSFKSPVPKEERNWLANRPSSYMGSLPFQYSSVQKKNFVKEEPKPSSYHPYNSSLDQNNKACSVHGSVTDPKFANDSSKPNCCEKRPARAPVVGWPPVRSFRKNLASNSSSKTPIAGFGSDQKGAPKEQAKIGNTNGIKSNNQDHMFVKINMEGVPIGRKVDLKAYDSYEKLSYAIDELFRGLLAAQRDYSSSETAEDIITDAKTVSNGEYTLVYEDNEGDRMLVGDVPWKMFVSTAKRLRVLRTVELSTLKLSNGRIEKTPLDSEMGVGK